MIRTAAANVAVLVAVVTFGANETTASEALPPEALDVVVAAFDRTDGGWRIASAGIEFDLVKGAACVQSGQCFAFRLTLSSVCTEEDRAGAWCLAFPETVPSESDRNILVRALAVDDSIAAWRRLGTSGQISARYSYGHLWTLLAVLAAAGLIGRYFRQVLPNTARTAMLATSSATFLLPLPLLLATVLPVGLPDLFFLGGLTTAGCYVGSRNLDRQRVARWVTATIAALLAFAAVEALLRLDLIAAPPLPRIDPNAVGLDRRASLLSDPRCALLHTSGLIADRLNVAAGQELPRILHLGDSILEGAGVAWEETATAELNRIDSRVAHHNFGAAGSGPDFQLLMLRRVLNEMTPAQVVLHVFPSNDLSDLNQSYACCPEGPILLDDGANLTARCPTPRWRFSKTSALLAPPPAALRLAAVHSLAAGHAWSAISHVQYRLASWLPPASMEQPHVLFDWIVRAMKEGVENRGTTLVAVVVPLRSDLERHARDPGDPALAESLAHHSRVVGVLKRVGIPVHDAWPLFEEALRSEPSDSLFIDPPGDPHFSPRGHELYAQWLHARFSGKWARLPRSTLPGHQGRTH